MNIQEIIAELELFRGYLPREALERAALQREDITPHLLNILEWSANNMEELDRRPEYIGHIYAMFLLAQFRESRAYPVIVDFFSHPGEIAMEVTGDLVTEDLPDILASVSNGDVSLIKALIENPDSNEWVRDAGLRSLVTLVKIGRIGRDPVMAYFKTLFDEKFPRTPSVIWDSLVCCSVDLYPEEVYKDIENLYRMELVDPFFIDESECEEALELGKEKALLSLSKNPVYRLIDNVIEELERWACFRADEHMEDQSMADQFMEDEYMEDEYMGHEPIEAVPGKKIGRNDPCFCGSGKKFKKCCLKRS
jgi:hypothetical protein